jgi:hypothetical protein
VRGGGWASLPSLNTTNKVEVKDGRLQPERRCRPFLPDRFLSGWKLAV